MAQRLPSSSSAPAFRGRNSAGETISLINDSSLKSRACERCRERHERCSPGTSHLSCLGCELANFQCRGYRPPTCEECYRNKKKCVYEGEGSCKACAESGNACTPRMRFEDKRNIVQQQQQQLQQEQIQLQQQMQQAQQQAQFQQQQQLAAQQQQQQQQGMMYPPPPAMIGPDGQYHYVNIMGGPRLPPPPPPPGGMGGHHGPGYGP